MPKAPSSSCNKLMIRHYEDEPQTVDFPDLIENALFQKADIEETSIESQTDMKSHKITFKFGGVFNEIYYEIRSSIKEMDDRMAEIGVDVDAVILNIVDLSINGDREYGLSIAKEIIKLENATNVWFITGYVVDTGRLLEENDMEIRVIAKPANHISIRNEVVDIIMCRLM